MRARNIKPGFFKNEELAEIDPLGRILYEGLWCMSDREGRLEDRPKKIKAEILPYDNCDIEKFLNDLAEHKFITRYEVNGKCYIWVNKFKAHQNPHKKEPESIIPPPENGGNYPGISGTCSEDISTGNGISKTDPADSFNLKSESQMQCNSKIDLYKKSKLKQGKSVDKNSPLYNLDYLNIALYLKKRILEKKPDACLPDKLDVWVYTVKLMIEEDKRNALTILQVIDWCQNNEFWRANILSMDKLRKHFDRLELDMKRKKEAPINGGVTKNRGDTAVGPGDISKLIIRAE